VVKIELREQKLTGVVPAALGGLTALKAGAYTRLLFSSTSRFLWDRGCMEGVFRGW